MHKLLVAYCSVVNIHPRSRSQLKILHLAIITEYAECAQKWPGITLRTLQELNELQDNGIHLSLEGHQVSLAVSLAVTACSGDSHSMNRLGGFPCSISRSSACHFSMAHASQLASLTREELCKVRSKQLHGSRVAANELNRAPYKRLYRVKKRSAMPHRRNLI